VEELKLEEEMGSIKDKVITPSTVDNTCFVYIQEEDIRVEEFKL